MKKYLIILALITIFLVSMCISPAPEPTNVTSITNNITENNWIEISGNMKIPNDICEAKNIKGKVIAIHQTGCGACAVAIPRLEELENELNKKFEYINLATESGIEKIKEIKILPYSVPTVIINCNAYIGAYNKETYKKLIEEI